MRVKEMTDYTPHHMTDAQLHEAAREMEVMGGGFAASIADAYFRADSRNRERLLSAFGDLFEKFSTQPKENEK